MNTSGKTLFSLLCDAGNAMPYEYTGEDRTVSGITDDTRKLSEGNIFICVKGKAFDGHSAAADMLERGAAAVVCDRDLGLCGRQIIVSDTKRFYGLLTAAWFCHPERKLSLIGITGTNGKTTTATMIHHILTCAGHKTGLIGTAETLIGKEPIERDDSTPTTPKVFELYGIFDEMVRKGCGYCVMEVSSFATEQQRIGPAVYDAAVFTNLTQDHLDYHLTMENYYLAKKLLFTDHCRRAFINTADEWGKRLFDEITCEKYSCTPEGPADFYASCMKYSEGAARFWLCARGKSYPFALSMMGSYNVHNAVFAIAVCLSLGVSAQSITQAVNSFCGVRGRCETIPTGKDFFIVCDYAHSPDALENMLPAIKEHTEGRLVCLFGCGGDRDRKKRPLMAKAAAKFADHLIITSDNPRNEDPDSIIDEIAAGIDKSVSFERITDRREAIFHAVKTAKKGDVIVLAGKGHEDYQILKGGVHIHFDEREICKRALAAENISTSLTVAQICAATGGRAVNIPSEDIGAEARLISSDTRTITPGSIFIAFKGERFDGHSFVPDAIAAGAICAVTERAIDDLPCIVVKSTAEAILKIAAAYRSSFDIRLVGITGSVGKTTTKEMTALALSSQYNTLKTEGNRNNEIGMPFTLLRLNPMHEAAAIEMGMSHFGEIDRLSRTCRPDIGIITNIGWSHAENLGSREGILKAKLEILNGMSGASPLVINGDDDMLLTILKDNGGRRIITCGVKNTECEYTAADICADGALTSFDVLQNGKRLCTVKLPAAGVHLVTDALLAFAAAREAGADSERIAQSLSVYKADGLRQHIERRGENTLLIDCYNAAPDSVRAAIDTLCTMTPEKGGRRVAVLGDMLELGERSDKFHEEIGEYAVSKGIDLLVCYGERAKYIAKRADELGMHCGSSTDADMVTMYLKQKLAPGDIVLFKASRGMHMEKIINTLFD